MRVDRSQVAWVVVALLAALAVACGGSENGGSDATDDVAGADVATGPDGVETGDVVYGVEGSPAPAANIEMTALTAIEAELRWTTAGDETGVVIEHSPLYSDTWSQIATLPAGTTTFDIPLRTPPEGYPEVTERTIYGVLDADGNYRVVLFNDKGYSKPSEPAALDSTYGNMTIAWLSPHLKAVHTCTEPVMNDPIENDYDYDNTNNQSEIKDQVSLFNDLMFIVGIGTTDIVYYLRYDKPSKTWGLSVAGPIAYTRWEEYYGLEGESQSTNHLEPSLTVTSEPGDPALYSLQVTSEVTVSYDADVSFSFRKSTLTIQKGSWFKFLVSHPERLNAN